MGGQLPQLVINEGQKLLGGRRVAPLDGVEDLRNVGHEKKFPRPCESVEL
jgi:hypothetical protein